MMDYFIQDVCLDKSGNVLMGVSPLDGNPACASHRDLLPGENLPYHKTGKSAGGAFQDNIPIDTGNPEIGLIAVQTSFGNPLAFGDGIVDILLQSSTTISSYMTLDQTGSTYHVNANCTGSVPNISASFDTDVHMDIDALSTTSGNTGTYGPGWSKLPAPAPVCPRPNVNRADQKKWFFADYRYPLPNGALTLPLKTLVLTIADPSTDDDITYTYYTREMGRMGFEAYHNVAGVSASVKALYQADHDKRLISGGCPTLAPPPSTPGGSWIEYQCGSNETTAPPLDAVHGDSPALAIDLLKASNMTALFFNATSTDNPHIASITPPTIPYGYQGSITITGESLSSAYFPYRVLVDFNGGVVYYDVKNTTSTSITFNMDSSAWNGSHYAHTIACGDNTVHVFDGVSNSNEIPFTVTGCKDGRKK